MLLKTVKGVVVPATAVVSTDVREHGPKRFLALRFGVLRGQLRNAVERGHRLRVQWVRHPEGAVPV